MKYRIDVMRLREGTMTLNGWIVPKQKKGYTELPGRESRETEPDGAARESILVNGMRFRVKDGSGRPLLFHYVPMQREDVAAIYGCDPACGFDIRFPYERGESYTLFIEAGGSSLRIPVNEAVIAKRNSVAHRKRERLLALCTPETARVAWEFLRANGLRALWKKSVHKLQGIEEEYDYSEWYEKTKPKESELKKQAEEYRALCIYVKEHGAVSGKEAAALSESGMLPRDAGSCPLLSIVVPAYNTPEKYLRMLLDSLRSQTYPNFELIVADGSEGTEEVARVMEEYGKKDPRFCYRKLSGNLGISENTNEGLKHARGEYIVLCDHDDELTPWALYELVKAIKAHPEAEFLYTDEDKVDFDGKALFEPHFKTDYNPDLLRTVNYICHLSAIRADLLQRVRDSHPEKLAFDPAYDGAQDYDFFLRCTELATETERAARKRLFAERREKNEKEREISAEGGASGTETRPAAPRGAAAAGLFTSEKVIHIPKVCYHWRCHKGSTSANPESKLYAFDAGKRAVLAHERRLGIGAKEVTDGITYGFYHTVFPESEEKISVLIPNKDHTEDLDKCIRSLVQRSMHRNLEIIVIENNSTEEKTWEYYRKIEQNPAFFLSDFEEAYTRLTEERRAEAERAARIKTTDRYQAEIRKEQLCDVSRIAIRIVRWEREFNYSAINNFGAQFATGGYLLFLNNDVELRNPDAFSEMLGHAAREEVGVVGARLLYEDHTVQHAGVVVGFGGIAGGTFIGTHERENSYMHRMMCVQDYSAVTAACMMSRKEVFNAAGGFSEELAVAFNDIDYCMKVRALGLLCVYDPYVCLFHYESKSRGLEDSPEKVARFNGEIAVFASRWPEILKNGDPYYNPNLTLRKSNFALRDLSREKPGEPFALELDVEKQLREVEKAKRQREKLS